MTDPRRPVDHPTHLRVLVCGGRNYPDKHRVHAELDQLASEHPMRRLVIISGGAQGADAHAETWSSSRRAATVVFRAQWRQFGRSAGPRRNQAMLNYGVDLVLAFPGGPGTADMVRRAAATGISVRTITPSTPDQHPETPIELNNGHGYTFGRWPRTGYHTGYYFGLAYQGHPTHMTYGTDYIDTQQMVQRTLATGRFYFDVGNNLYCTAAEFERCMRHTGLYTD